MDDHETLKFLTSRLMNMDMGMDMNMNMDMDSVLHANEGEHICLF
jgi:hypothetical protein